MASLEGFFATESAKTISIIEGQPQPNWVTCAFTDENDPMDINGQMFYVPKELFDRAVKAYIAANAARD